uniref:EXS domain-containing protein n=1 Tax=Macrostomum lignano TaxID=282301 RepID=A0A1I8HB79_9PLAT
ECSGLAYGLAPLFGCLPAWFRFAQCLRRYWDMPERHAFPHLVNAGKYSMTFFATAGAVAHHATGNWIALTVHICLFLLAAAYGYTWDILMDWGLLYRPKEGQLLREDLRTST